MTIFFNILFLLLLVSCSHSSLNVDFHFPTARMQIPETTGGRVMDADADVKSVRLTMDAHSAANVSLGRSDQSKSIFSGNIGAVVIDDEKEITSSGGLGLGLQIGVKKRLDIVIKKSNEAPYEFGLQYQLMGVPGRKEKGFKLSISATVGFQTDEEVSTEWFADEDDEYDNVTAKTEISSSNISLIMGYRMSKKFLPYINIFYDHYTVESNLVITGGTSHNFDTNGEQTGVLIGFALGSGSGYLQLEGGVTKVKVGGASDYKDLDTFAIGFGAEF